MPHELTEENKVRWYDTTLVFLSQLKNKTFYFKLSQTMKSGYSVIILNVKNHG